MYFFQININAALADERTRRSGEIIALPPPKKDEREKELSSMIKDMETKHGLYLIKHIKLIIANQFLSGSLTMSWREFSFCFLFV